MLLAFAILSLAACDEETYNDTPQKEEEKKALIFSASGDIVNSLDEFRSQLGDSLNTTPGKTSGRREVNWDNLVTEVRFKVPGANQDAYVKGFGAIFSGVNLDNSTTIEFCDGNKSIGIFPVKPKAGNNTLSFLGVYFPDDKVTLVKIKAGNTKLAAGVQDDQYKDLVIMDDFLYNEPLAVEQDYRLIE